MSRKKTRESNSDLGFDFDLEEWLEEAEKADEEWQAGAGAGQAGQGGPGDLGFDLEEWLEEAESADEQPRRRRRRRPAQQAPRLQPGQEYAGAEGLLVRFALFMAKVYRYLYVASYLLLLVPLVAGGAWLLAAGGPNTLMGIVLLFVAAVLAIIKLVFHFLSRRRGEPGYTYPAMMLAAAPGQFFPPLLALPPLHPLAPAAANPLKPVLEGLAVLLLYATGIVMVLGGLLIAAGNIINSMFTGGQRYWGGSMGFGQNMIAHGTEMLVNSMLMLAVIGVEIKPDVMAIASVSRIEDLDTASLGPVAHLAVELFRFPFRR